MWGGGNDLHAELRRSSNFTCARALDRRAGAKVNILINPDTHSHLNPDSDSPMRTSLRSKRRGGQPPHRIVEMCDIFISASWYPVASGKGRNRPFADAGIE